MGWRLEVLTIIVGSLSSSVGIGSWTFGGVVGGSGSDLAISSSSDACRASSCALGCGDRGGRALLVERADDLREGDLIES